MVLPHCLLFRSHSRVPCPMPAANPLCSWRRRWTVECWDGGKGRFEVPRTLVGSSNTVALILPPRQDEWVLTKSARAVSALKSCRKRPVPQRFGKKGLGARNDKCCCVFCSFLVFPMEARCVCVCPTSVATQCWWRSWYICKSGDVRMHLVGHGLSRYGLQNWKNQKAAITKLSVLQLFL